jgi:hypothetical protein
MLDEDVKKAGQITRQISAILADNKPEVQGAALADLLAMWLAGHRQPELREAMLANHLFMVRALVPVNEEILFGGSDARH